MVYHHDPFLTSGFAKGFGSSKKKQVIAQSIIEAESEPPLPSKNHYQDPLEMLRPPVDYHDAKAMLVYLSDAPERALFKRNYLLKAGIRTALLLVILCLLLMELFFVFSDGLRFFFWLFFIIFSVVFGMYVLAVFIDMMVFRCEWKSIADGRFFRDKDPDWIRKTALYYCEMHNKFVTGLKQSEDASGVE